MLIDPFIVDFSFLRVLIKWRVTRTLQQHFLSARGLCLGDVGASLWATHHFYNVHQCLFYREMFYFYFRMLLTSRLRTYRPDLRWGSYSSSPKWHKWIIVRGTQEMQYVTRWTEGVKKGRIWPNYTIDKQKCVRCWLHPSHSKTVVTANKDRSKSFNVGLYIGVASYGALGHVPPSWLPTV